jgi:hypothetical protein
MGIITRFNIRSRLISVTDEVMIFFLFTALFFWAPPVLYSSAWQHTAIARNDARAQAMSEAQQQALDGGATEEEAKKAGQDAANEIGPAMAATKSLPIWGWVVMGAVYVLIVTVWWKPADQEADNIELLSLAIVSTLLVVGLCVWYHREVGSLYDTFKGIFKA